MSEAEALFLSLVEGGERNVVCEASPMPQEASVEASLIASARAGEAEAFGSLYDLYAPMVHGLLLARLPWSEVDDILQDVFVQAFKRLHTLREDDAFGGWLAMIARNRATDFYRRAHHTTELTDDIPARMIQPDGEASEALAAIRALPSAYRETLVLRFVEGMTGMEIAARTGLTHASVRVNLSRGVKMLREKLGMEKQEQ